MIKSILFWALGLFFAFVFHASADGQQAQHGAVWMFGEENVVDFSTGSPVLSVLPNTGGGPPYRSYYFAGAVCNRAGSLLFWGKIFNTTSLNQFVLYDRSGQAMPNGLLLTSGVGRGVPVIVPHPADTNQYYFCYLRNGTLRYSLIDLRLNSGMGDVVVTQKDILLGTEGSLADRKLVAVPGCTGAWLVVRSRILNEYYSYHISTTGISSVPVVSVCGRLPISSYGDITEYSGVLQAANGGGKMVAACSGSMPDPQIIGKRIRFGGLELYDFAPCSGVLSNPVVLDTGYYFGATFSPDNSKLYGTRIFERTLFQFDLSQPTVSAMAASKTMILTNPNNNLQANADNLLGDIKAGSDGRLYLGTNNCSVYPFTNALHVIANPNVAGAGCTALISGYTLQAGSAACTGLNLPAEIITPNQQDTIRQSDVPVPACFRSQLWLAPDTMGTCFAWEDGSTAPARTVDKDSVYHVRFTDQDCRLHIASYKVSFVRIQPVAIGGYACPGTTAGVVIVQAKGPDTAIIHYRWTDARGTLLRESDRRIGDTLRGLDTGSYAVRLFSTTGCDTTLILTVKSIPKPLASGLSDSLVCKGTEVHLTSTSSAPLCRWIFGYGEVEDGRAITRTFPVASEYKVLQVVQNAEGCTDTLEHTVVVKGLDIELTADKATVAIGDEINLHAQAGEAFRTIAWTPVGLFPQPAAVDQQVRVDSSTRFIVTGISAFGCVDSAAVMVAVDPVIFVPTAFTPNGDGMNDRFRVRSAGADIFVRHCTVYDRWGHLVWGAYGTAAAAGWDGTAVGKACAAGVYFYALEAETAAGKPIHRKGDITLVR